MAEQEKVILEREYIVPLRKEWIKKPYYKRTPRAVKTLRKFIARHMKVEDRDLKKVKLDKWLNAEMWCRSIRKPYSKIKVKAKKLESGIVMVELVDVPVQWKFKIEKEKLGKEASEKVKKEKAEKKKALGEQVKKADEEAKKDIEEEKKKEEGKEKEKSEEQAMKIESTMKHKEMRHESAIRSEKKTYPKRKSLEK